MKNPRVKLDVIMCDSRQNLEDDFVGHQIKIHMTSSTLILYSLLLLPYRLARGRDDLVQPAVRIGLNAMISKAHMDHSNEQR